MLSFAPRTALPSSIGPALYEKILNSSEVLGKDAKGEFVKNDCEFVQSLRERIERDGANTPIDVLEDYLSCVQLVLLKLDLELHEFVWTNSIGCSRAPVQGMGLRYESLNVLFNIASHYTQQAVQLANEHKWADAKISFQTASGVLIRARKVELHQLSHVPPVELQNSTLAFLHFMVIAQATECEYMVTKDPSQAWETHLRYQRLANEAESHSVFSPWHENLQRRAGHFGSLACLRASEAYKNSRKQSDQALEYAALLKALDLATNNDTRVEIQSTIDAPRGRTKKTLSAMTEPAAFDDKNYFIPKVALGPIDFAVPKPTRNMLARLLPLSVASSPLILSEKLKDYVEKEIGSQLYNINRYIRSVMVKCTSPCSLELLCQPNSSPKSLLKIAQRMRRLGGIKKLQEMLELGFQEARHCDAILASVQSIHTDKDEFRALLKCASAGMHGLQIIKAKFDRSAHLIELLDRGDPLIANFLGVSRSGGSQPALAGRHAPAALVYKSEAFYGALGERIYRRSLKCFELENKAREYNFFGPVMSVVESHNQEPKEWNLKDFTGCFESALAEFEPAKRSLQSEKLQAEEDVESLLRIENELRKVRQRQNTSDGDQLKACQTLMFAALQFYDISYNLKESHRYYNALNTAVSNFRDRSNNTVISIGVSDTSLLNVDEPSQRSVWRPGMTIDFA